MKPRYFITKWLLCGPIFWSCGDALVDGHYRGESLFTLRGSIEPDQYIDGADLICSVEG